MKKYEGIEAEINRLEIEINKLKGTKGLDKDLVDKLRSKQIYFGGK